MNIHPLFVHFPIGLLVLYSLLEIVSYFVRSWRESSGVASIKSFLLFAGVLGAFAAIVTGGIAEDLVRDYGADMALVEVHSTAAGLTTLLYLILAAAYIVRMFERTGWGDRICKGRVLFVRIWNMKKSVAHAVRGTVLAPILALVALGGMLVTGALGAAIVYGVHIDPFVFFVYSLFFQI